MKKNNQNGFASVVIVILVLAIIGGIFIFYPNPRRQQVEQENSISATSTVATTSETITGTKKTLPAPSVNTVVSKLPDFNEYGFAIFLPKDWSMKVENKEVKSYTFNLYPDNNNKPANRNAFGITVYDYQPTIEKWIEKHASEYKGKLEITKEKNFSGKPVYHICDTGEAGGCDTPMLGINTTVVLGGKYSYALYPASQDPGYVYERIEKEIFPNIIIE